MNKYARIIGNIAIDISSNPAAQFHPVLAAQFVQVPEQVQRGWRLTETGWVPNEPTPMIPPVKVYPQVSPIQFSLLFTPTERLAIKAVRATNPVLDDYYLILEDNRLTHVDLNLKSVQNSLHYLQSLGIITDERRLVILEGVIE